jgi:hypothetical protein
VTPKRNFIAWCRKLRDDLKEQLDALESGSSRLREKHGSKWVDTTAQATERTKARLAEIHWLLTDVRSKPTPSQDEAWARVVETFPGAGAKTGKHPTNNRKETGIGEHRS